MRRAKQTNKKKSPDNNEHSPDWFRCITHRLSPHCLFSTLPGVPAVQKVCEQKFSPRRKFEGGKNRAAGSLCECVPTRSAATGLSRRVTMFFFPPKTDRVKGHMEMIHFGVYWRTLWVIACRRQSDSWGEFGEYGFHRSSAVHWDLLNYPSAPFYSSTCQQSYIRLARRVCVGAHRRGSRSAAARESHRDLTIMWQSCSTRREMTLLHFYIKSTDRIHF